MFGFLQKLFCPSQAAQKQLVNLRNSQLESCHVQKQHLLDKGETYKKIIKSQHDVELTLKETLEKQLNTISKLRQQTNNLKPINVPSKDITYRRPVLMAKNEYQQVEIDVRSFIMPDFTMENEVRKEKLYYDGSQDLDLLIPKIYKLAKKRYKYARDSQFGFSEYLMFPFESRAVLKKGKGIDCDDWAILIGSYFAAAGIPRDKWVLSFGIARAGYGHATIYVQDSVQKWRHLNSTYSKYKYVDLKKYPSNKDKKDLPGIKDGGFWFSFNDLFSFNLFESEESEKEFSQELKHVVKIK